MATYEMAFYWLRNDVKIIHVPLFASITIVTCCKYVAQIP